MHVLWFIAIILYQFTQSHSWFWTAVPLEKYHYPGQYTTPPPKYINNTDTEIPKSSYTPDYRVEERMLERHRHDYRHENDRPYRNSPPRKQSQKGMWSSGYWNNVEMQMGCYCCTVYRRLILLAGCAVISTKHILTTATSTVLILRSYGHLPNLDNILGGWYDTDGDHFNASLYFTPSRIHIHEKYVYDYEVNVSHPIPAMYDLSVWVATFTFWGGWEFSIWHPITLFGQFRSVIICTRAASGTWEYTSSIPRVGDMSIVAGFQFMKSYKRRPTPWHRYIIKTHNHVWPCPKSDWHWFHCIAGEYWGKYGFDSGGGMTGIYRNKGWRRDGMVGLGAFSLKLRANQTVHYFTVVDTHPVLDFLYDAFLGLKKCAYLDSRFEDTKWSSPQPYYGEHIPWSYKYGHQCYYALLSDPPNYRR